MGGKWQIVLFVGFLEFFSESGAAGAHYTKGGKPGAFPSFNSPEAGDQFKIPHPVFFDFWDPVGFTKNASPEKKERGRLIEINNGRLAMLGLFGFLAESKCPRSAASRCRTTATTWPRSPPTSTSSKRLKVDGRGAGLLVPLRYAMDGMAQQEPELRLLF